MVDAQDARIRRVVRQELASLFSPQSLAAVKTELEGQIPMPKTAMRNVETVVAAVERAMWKAWRLQR